MIKNKIYLFIIMFVFPVQGLASTHDISSSLEYIQTGNFEQAVNELHSAEAVYKERSEKDSVALVLNMRGLVFKRLGELDSAYKCLSEAMFICLDRDNDNLLKSIYNNMALIHELRSEYSKALIYHKYSLEIEKKFFDSVGIGVSLYNTGNIYYELAEYKSAIEYYKSALIIAKNNSDTVSLENCYNNMALAYTESGYYNEAEECNNKSLDYATKTKNLFGESISYMTKAMIRFQRGKFAESRKYYNKALSLSIAMNDPYSIAIAKISIAKLYYVENKYDSARTYAESANEIFSAGNYRKAYSESLLIYAEILAALNDYKSAYSARVQSNKINRRISQLFADGISRITDENMKYRETITSRNYALLILIVIVLFVIICIYIARKKNAVIKHCNYELQCKNEYLSLNLCKLANVQKIIEEIIRPKIYSVMHADKPELRNEIVLELTDRMGDLIIGIKTQDKIVITPPDTFSYADGKLSWNAVPGAEMYEPFYMDGSTEIVLGQTVDTYYLWMPGAGTYNVGSRTKQGEKWGLPTNPTVPVTVEP